MKISRLTILAIALLQNSFAGRISEIDNDALVKAFHGHDTPGFTESALEEELASSEAPALIQKFSEDSQLRRFLPSFPRYIKNEEIKDDLIFYILNEPDIWHADDQQHILGELSVAQVHMLVDSALLEEFFLTAKDIDIPKFKIAILQKSTRPLVATLFKRITQLDPTQRAEGIIDDLRQLLSKVKGEREDSPPPSSRFQKIACAQGS